MNLAKSKVVLLGEVPDVKSIANILKRKISQLLLKYLGLSMGAPFKLKSICNVVLEKNERKLVSWKMYLSRGGGVTLIKSSSQTCQPPSYYYFGFPPRCLIA